MVYFLQKIYFIYFLLLFIILILIAIPFTLLFGLLPQKMQDKMMYYMLRAGGGLLFLLTGIIPINKNKKNINFNKSYIIMPTHKSYLDAATLYSSIPVVFKTLAKKEIERVPLYNIIYRSVCITIDRTSVSAKAAGFRKMKSELQQGNSIVIFPEGTFADVPQKNLLPFHDGAFTLAIMQQADILPILYLDTEARMHPKHITRMSPGLNRAIFLAPISVSKFNKEDMVKLKLYTQHYMQYCIDSYYHDKNVDLWLLSKKYLSQNVMS